MSKHFVSKPARPERCPTCKAMTVVGLVEGIPERVNSVGEIFTLDRLGRLVRATGFRAHECADPGR